jgi:hypothetical protein
MPNLPVAGGRALDNEHPAPEGASRERPKSRIWRAPWPNCPPAGRSLGGTERGPPVGNDKMMRANGFLSGLMLCAWLLGCSAEVAEVGPGRELEAEAAEAAEALSSNALTKKQASTVLGLIDDICGDSWCEGDHNFHFDQIQCQRGCSGASTGTCQVTFRIFPYDSDLETGPTYVRSCKTPGFTGFSSLVDTAANGYQSLHWDYYDALSACISEVENELPPI